MNLEQLTQIVGPIKRGRLESGFNPESDERSTVKLRDRSMVDPEREWRVEPPPITEDLSHLASPPHKKPELSLEERLRRVKPSRRKLYRSIYDRGECLATIAEKSGIAESVVQLAFAGRATLRTKERIGRHLTQRERKMLGWQR